MSYQRFTVFTQDADSTIYLENRKRRFIWKLGSNKVFNEEKSLKMSIESIHCRNMLIKINANENVVFGSNPAVAGDDGANVITHKTIAMGNTDEKELYTIRCSAVSSVNNIDTRPAKYKTSPIIYIGSLNYHNNNTRDSFCYEVNKDILTNDFILDIDTNFRNPTTQNNTVGLSPNLQVALTFILYPE